MDTFRLPGEDVLDPETVREGLEIDSWAAVGVQDDSAVLELSGGDWCGLSERPTVEEVNGRPGAMVRFSSQRAGATQSRAHREGARQHCNIIDKEDLA